jgi:hypothetical protein
LVECIKKFKGRMISCKFVSRTTVARCYNNSENSVRRLFSSYEADHYSNLNKVYEKLRKKNPQERSVGDVWKAFERAQEYKLKNALAREEAATKTQPTPPTNNSSFNSNN